MTGAPPFVLRNTIAEAAQQDFCCLSAMTGAPACTAQQDFCRVSTMTGAPAVCTAEQDFCYLSGMTRYDRCASRLYGAARARREHLGLPRRVRCLRQGLGVSTGTASARAVLASRARREHFDYLLGSSGG